MSELIVSELDPSEPSPSAAAPPNRFQHSVADELVVVVGADQNYAIGLAVALQSALENYAGERHVSVFVLDGGILPWQRERIERILARFSARCTWIAPDMSLLRDLKTAQHFTTPTYLRLLIPALLPANVHKAVYLDSDLLVEADLDELWRTDLSGVYLAAAQDPLIGLVSSPAGLLNYRELGFVPEARYFNSGVLVLNLASWRMEDFGQRVMTYVRENPQYVRIPDQDGLNAVAAGKWREMNACWNRLPQDADDCGPQIVHFMTNHKPWQGYRLGDSGSRWQSCLRRSGYLRFDEWLPYYAEGKIRYLVRWLLRRPHR